MPIEARRRSVQCLSPAGLHRMAYLEWGDPRNPDVLVCVHGLTRTGRDFDSLARVMAEHYRVVCPDIVGRGESDWLADPAYYVTPQYIADIVTLIARLDVAQVHWVGTSMGALIGMALASLKGSPVSRMVMNDAGPVLAREALVRIASYVGTSTSFRNIDEAETYIRTVSAPFGPHNDAQWRFLTETVTRANADGSLRLHYDSSISKTLRASVSAQDIDLWSYYDAVSCPTLVLRGAQSDLLSSETMQAMATRGPRAHCVEFQGVGHAPTLMNSDQIDPVRDFLLADLR
jgi:pimeloyl-ACP methyl ester carboxylesterase